MRQMRCVIIMATCPSIPGLIVTDINGFNRRVNPYVGANTVIDAGAYEREFSCPTPTVEFSYSRNADEYIFSTNVINISSSNVTSGKLHLAW